MIEFEISVDEGEVTDLLDLSRRTQALTTLWELIILVQYPDYSDFRFDRNSWYSRRQVIDTAHELQLTGLTMSSPLKASIEAVGPDAIKSARIFARLLETVRDWKTSRRQGDSAADRAAMQVEMERELLPTRIAEEKAMSEFRIRQARAETELLEEFVARAEARGAEQYLSPVLFAEGARELPSAQVSFGELPPGADSESTTSAPAAKKTASPKSAAPGKVSAKKAASAKSAAPGKKAVSAKSAAPGKVSAKKVSAKKAASAKSAAPGKVSAKKAASAKSLSAKKGVAGSRSRRA